MQGTAIGGSAALADCRQGFVCAVLDYLRVRNPEVRSVLLYGLSTAVAAGLTLILTRVLWRALTPEAFGLWALIDPILIPAGSLMLLGVNHAIVKQLQVDRTPLNQVVGTLLLAGLPAALACLLLLGFVFDRIAHFPWTDALLLAVAGEALIIVLQSAFRAAGAVRSFAILAILRNLIYLGILWVLLANSPGHLPLGLVFLARGLCVCGLGLAGLLALRPRLRADWKRYLDALKYGFPLLLTILIASAADMADRWFLANFDGVRAVGVYTIHLKLSGILSQAIVIPFGLWFPRERFRRFDAPDGGRRFFVRTAIILAILCVYLSGLVWLARDLLLSLLAPGVMASSPVVALCVGSVTCLALSQALNVGLLMPGHTTKNAMADAIALAAGLLGAAVMVPFFGTYGAAGSRFASGFTLLVVSAAWSRRVFEVAFPFGPLTSYAGLSVGALALIDWASPASGRLAIATSLLAWTMVTLLLSAVLLRRPLISDGRPPVSEFVAIQIPKLP